MLDIHEIETRLNEFENIMCTFFRQNPIDQENTTIREMVDNLNDWIKRTGAELEIKRSKLQKLIESINKLEENITVIEEKVEKQRPGLDDSSSTSHYNHLIQERNSLVQEHNKLIQEYDQNQELYNKEVEEVNQEQERRRAEIELFERNAAEKIEEYQRWIKEKGPLQFFNKMNVLYATLIQEIRRNKRYKLEEYVNRHALMRKELGSYVKQEHDKNKEHGHIVQAVLCQSEECYLIVDSGASVTSITPEMVDILGIHRHVGDEVEIQLPNAIQIKAPQLVIPKITVKGFEADYVKAVVLEGSEEGIDGCLGLSFLNKFDYVIDNQGLFLNPQKSTEKYFGFDIFICHKSHDFSAAKEVFDLLSKKGYRPFLSEISLAEYKMTEFQKAIDITLEGVEHMVIVTSSVSNIETPWVEAEWRSFESLKRSGKKIGNIIPLFCGDISLDELPLALRRYHALTMNDPTWKEEIINYLPKKS